MSSNQQNISHETIEILRKQLLNRIEQIDDASLLSRCMAVIETDEAMKEEQDQIDCISFTTPEDFTLSPKPTVDWRRLLIVASVLLLALGGYWLAIYIKKNSIKPNVKVTVAKDYETIEVKGCRFNMVKVKGGSFTMGATEDMSDFDIDERPIQKVTLSDYSIGETEVTQGLWYAVTGERPITPDGDDHPMKDVSYNDCISFIEKLNLLTGRHFHLPSEAQWEFAARGGNQSHHYRFAGSNNIDEVAWYSSNSWDLGKGDPDFGNHPVGSKKPNELGLYDMSGNVWEWCNETFIRYDGTAKVDPGLNDTIQGAFRCNRGGSWDYISISARVSNRRKRTRDFRNFDLGLRLAE